MLPVCQLQQQTVLIWSVKANEGPCAGWHLAIVTRYMSPQPLCSLKHCLEGWPKSQPLTMSELLIVPDRSRAPASASIEILLIRNASNRSSVFYTSLRANYLFFCLCLNCFTLMSVGCVSTSALCECVLVSCNDSSRDSSSPLSLYGRYQRSSGLIASARFLKTNWAPVNKKKREKKCSSTAPHDNDLAQWVPTLSSWTLATSAVVTGYIEILGEEAEEDWEVNGNQTECINYHQIIIDIVAHPAHDPSQIMH